MPNTRHESTAPRTSPTGPQSVDLAPLCIRAEIVRPASIDDEAREVDITWTTGAGVERYDWMNSKRYIEKLSLLPGHVRIDRLNEGGPLLDGHSAWSVVDMLGAVVPGSVELTKGQGRARVRFSRREAVAGVWQDVKDGIVRSVSVGYRVYRYEETEEKGNKLPVRTATDWEPFEVSMVPIPADAGAMARGAKPADTNRCEIVTRATAQSSKEIKVMEPTNTPQDRSEFVVEQPALPPVTRTAPEAPVPIEENDNDRGRAAERERVQGIISACVAARLPRSFQDRLIADGKSLVDCQREVFEEMRKRGAEDAGPSRIPSGASRIEVGDDPMVHHRAGIEEAILHRVAPEYFKLTAVGREYRGMSLLEIGRAYLNAIGIRTTHMSRSRVAEEMLVKRGGEHTTSDFPTLLADVANKTLRAAYEAAPQTWRALAKMIPASDFKQVNPMQIGDAPELLEVLEHGEFTQGTITEGKEPIKLKTWGRKFAITRQALINDDLRAFNEIPAAFGRKSADLLSDRAWAQITSNPNMNDGVALFHANHANLSGSSDAISTTSLGAARAAMRVQKGLDGKTLLNLIARYLIVPAAKETLADQNTTQITPAQASNVNPFGPSGRTPLTTVAEPRLDAASTVSWYVACDAAQAPVLHYITLDGQEGPEVRQQEGFNVDGIEYRCRLDANFAPADFRAIFKNPGA